MPYHNLRPSQRSINARGLKLAIYGIFNYYEKLESTSVHMHVHFCREKFIQESFFTTAIRNTVFSQPGSHWFL